MEYRIDYDNIDVADIMDQIKKKASERPPEPSAPAPGASAPPPAVPAPSPAPLPPSRGWKGMLKRTLRFFLRPYLPILIAADEWYRFRTNLSVNVRIDKAQTDLETLEAALPRARQELSDRIVTTRETVKLLHNLSHNLVVELTKLKIEEEALKSKVRVLEKELETLGNREKAIEKKVFE